MFFFDIRPHTLGDYMKKMILLLLLSLVSSSSLGMKKLSIKNKCLSPQEAMELIARFRNHYIYSSWYDLSKQEEKELYHHFLKCRVSSWLYRDMFFTIGGEDHQYRLRIARQHQEGHIDGRFYMKLNQFVYGWNSDDKKKIQEMIEAAQLEKKQKINGEIYLLLLKNFPNWTHQERVQESRI